MENNEERKKNFKDRVLASIEAKHVKAYSKAHFTLRVILLALLAAVILIVSVLLVNFALFTLRISGRAMLLNFGPQGILIFIRVFPWPLLAFDIALILILEWLLQRFKFGYRSPVLYSLIAIFAIAISAGLIIDRGTRFNDLLLRDADDRRLPGAIGSIYRGARRPPLDSGICECQIEVIASTSVSATDLIARPTTTVIVILPEGFPAGSLAPGDVVFVAGQRVDSTTIQAFGIGSLPPNSIEPHPERGEFFPF